MENKLYLSFYDGAEIENINIPMFGFSDIFKVVDFVRGFNIPYSHLCLTEYDSDDEIVNQVNFSEFMDTFIKPCPFCGSKNVRVQTEIDSEISVKCFECGGRGKKVTLREAKVRDFDERIIKQKHLAVEAWNNRKEATL